MQKVIYALGVVLLLAGTAHAQTPACGPNVPMKNVAADSRCFELRTYTVSPASGSNADPLHKRFREHTNTLFKKHGMQIVGFWQPVSRPDQLIAHAPVSAQHWL